MSNLSRKHITSVRDNLSWILEDIEEDLEEGYIGIKDIKEMLRYAERFCEDLRFIFYDLQDKEDE